MNNERNLTSLRGGTTWQSICYGALGKQFGYAELKIASHSLPMTNIYACFRCFHLKLIGKPVKSLSIIILICVNQHLNIKIPMKKIILIITLAFGFNASFGQEEPKKWSLTGYVKDMQTIIFNEPGEQWITDNLIHNRLNFHWYATESLTFSAQARNRFMWGEMVSSFPGYAESIDQQIGWFDLTENFLEEKSFVFNSSIDRLYFDYNKGKFQVKLGRQRINWGQTFAWNPNDIFNAYSFFDFDYEEKPGSDAIRAVYYINYASQIELAAKVNHKDEVTAAALYKFNYKNYDYQLIAGVLDENDWLAGGGWSGQIKNVAFRGEFTYFYPKEKENNPDVFTGSIGFDYTFKNSLMLQFETLYKSNGNKNEAFNLNELYYNEISAKNLSLNQITLFTQVSYPITPLINSSLSVMYSPNDQSVFLGPGLTGSLSDNTEVSVNVQSFYSEAAKNNAQAKSSFVFLRLKYSF